MAHWLEYADWWNVIRIENGMAQVDGATGTRPVERSEC